MRSDWPHMTLRDAGVILIDCVHQTPADVGEGYPYIAIPQMKEGRIDFNANPRLISENDFLEWTQKANPRENDVVLSRRCNPGETAYVPNGVRFALGQNLVLLRADESRFYPPFLRWLAKGPQWWGQVNKFLNVGAVFDSLRCADVPNFELPIPNLDEQKSIAHILGSLDDKIELNRQMNTTLDSMAQALFKSWFVDFDPVIDNALAAGNPIPEPLHARAKIRKALGDKRKPLPEAIQKQFPSRFVFSEEMGWLPEGWQPTPLNHIANYQNGLALQKFRPENEYDFLPVIKIAQLKKGYADGEEKASPNINPECIIDDGDVLFSWSGSLMVDVWCGGKGALNQHLFKVTSNKFPKWFYYEYTKFHLIEFQRIAADKAVTMGHIKREHLHQAFCLVPPKGLFERCSHVVECLLERHIDLRKQNKQLETLRDTLLPKLLSGKLRVPEAEKLMSEAL
jgi:type I restriction enzyme, S subunit